MHTYTHTHTHTHVHVLTHVTMIEQFFDSRIVLTHTVLLYHRHAYTHYNFIAIIREINEKMMKKLIKMMKNETEKEMDNWL